MHVNHLTSDYNKEVKSKNKGGNMRVYLIMTQIVYVLCLIPWLPIWGLSFMSFDGGFSFYNILFVLIISLYPVAVIACTILSWIFRKKEKQQQLSLT